MRLFGGGSSVNEAEASLDDVANAISSGSHAIVDVRELDEWQAGHIAGAVHIPLGELNRRLNELEKSTPIYTVCLSGARSTSAAKILNDAGFTGTKSMRGGMSAWAQAGKPYV